MVAEESGTVDALGHRGVSYEPSSGHPISEWSLAVYGELASWAADHNGRWEFWSPDYLVLTIDHCRGDAIQPVMIDTCEGELTITFGYWECHLPDEGVNDETDSHRAASRAIEMTRAWLSGKTATAIYFSDAGKWCGSKLLVEPVDPQTLTDISWIADFGPATVEIRKARRAEWRRFNLSNGVLEETF